MRLHISTSDVDGRVAVDVEVDDHALDQLTIGELVGAAVGRDAGALRSVRLDGAGVRPTTPAAELPLIEGSELSTGDEDSRTRDPRVRLDVVGGLRAGGRRALPSGTHQIGRSPFNEITVADPTMSRVHARLEVDERGRTLLTDLGSRNGCRTGDRLVATRSPVDGKPFALGASLFRARPIQASALTIDDRRDRGSRDDPAGPRAAQPHNRPPRPAPDVGPAPLTAPVGPTATAALSSALSWTMVGVPLVLGGVLALVFGPAMALFALLSPVLLVANWWESRRRNRKHSRRARRAFVDGLDRFAAELDSAGEEERARRDRAQPDPARLVARATSASPRLWERRPVHADFSVMRVGLGDVPWQPTVDDSAAEPPDEVRFVLDTHRFLRDTPVTIDRGDGWLGVVGPRPAALSVARWLVCQAAVLTGPADLAVALVCDPSTVSDWPWIDWLPHVAPPSRGSLLAGDDETAEAVAAGISGLVGAVAPVGAPRPPGAVEPGRHALLVVDRTRPWSAAGRGLQRLSNHDAVSAIVLASGRRDLPARCRWVLELDGDHGKATLHDLITPRRTVALLADGCSMPTAAVCARSLARFTDPLDEDAVAAALPARVDLLPALGIHVLDADTIADRWSEDLERTGLDVVVGTTAAGPFAIDICADGPHALLAGTTGAGKSELLRTWVASLAVTYSPDEVTFVLVDYKGGAAFDTCADLPHTVGLVTDLDEQLGARALLSLDAELTHREGVLRTLGAPDLPSYREHLRRGRTGPPLPRLVVIVDEFATLAAELPSFLDALVGIAQRGRSLGVHLVLATQRPSGVVNDNIRTNTNLRIALRVLDRADSTDVLGTDDGARLPRSRPGRAVVRLGEGELVTFQAALVSSRSATSRSPRATVRPRRPWWDDTTATTPHEPTPVTPPTDRSDLDRLVRAVNDAYLATRRAAPRRPWIDPLPERLSLADLPIDAHGASRRTQEREPIVVPIALLDDPTRQRQRTWHWSPSAGGLLVYGMPGSGTTTALTTVALSLAATYDPDRCHLYIIDFGHGALRPLADLPHTGAYIAAQEGERQQRLIRFLVDTVEHRQAALDRSDLPALVSIIDGFAAMRAAYDELHRLRVLDDVLMVFRDGPAVGVHLALTGERPNAIPPTMSSLTDQRVALRLPDLYDYASLGVRVAGLPGRPGRGYVTPGLEVQIASIEGPLEPAVAAIATRAAGPGRSPRRIDVLPSRVRRTELEPPDQAPVIGIERSLCLATGLGDDDLRTACLRLRVDDHVLVAGPSGSGRTTTLDSLAAAAAEAGAVVLRLDRATTLVDVGNSGAPVVVLVDDADQLEDAPALEEVLDGRRSGVHIIAAVHSARFRSAYGHWANALRSCRTGIALQPDVDLDGDLWSVRLPRPPSLTERPPPGRAVLVDRGACAVVQVAHP